MNYSMLTELVFLFHCLFFLESNVNYIAARFCIAINYFLDEMERFVVLFQLWVEGMMNARVAT